MVVGEPNINNIMGGIENTGSVRLHNHRKKLKQRFDIIKKLGQGTYGKVQLGINKETGQEVAIKTIKKSKIETEADLVRIRREIQIMSSVQHPNIIHIYEVFENREKMVLVMEYAAGGELYDYLSERKVLVEEEARRIFRQIATACYYCHKHKICHRDLKLENILLDEHGNAKIADFGLSNVFDDQRLLSTFCGSPLYASPEIVKGTPYQGPEVDCWSLGVLLYTLVYGAMPFDGSNFKRLVKQISQGDYFEPKKPSRASPLIHDMLTVNPKNRANIEKICMHWWVNETYDECCFDISEELANQTPVRLDLLLSLAPPPPQLESEKLVVTGEVAGDEASINSENTAPTRSQSAGSLMDMTNSAERRIKDLLTEDLKSTPKRKLETTVSTDQANLSKEGVKRKEKIVKENTVADITLHSPIHENVLLEDASMSEESPVKTATRSMDVELADNLLDQGAVCSEIIEEAKKNENKKVEKATPEKSVEKTKDIPQLETTKASSLDKENVVEVKKEEEKQKPESKIPAKRKIVKKKVLTDKNDSSEPKTQPAEKPKPKQQTESEQKTETEEAQPPTKPVERRRSRIFETTEKFQNLISSTEPKAPAEKPKKIVIPGVNVGGFKKEFERKASLTGSPKISLPKKQSSLEQDESPKSDESVSEAQKPVEPTPVDPTSPVQDTSESTSTESQLDQNKRAKIQNAVSVISNALDGTRKSKSRPCMTRKPPVPFGSSGRSASGSIQTLPLLHSPPAMPPSTPQKTDLKESQGSTPAQVVEQDDENAPEENKTSMAEITLKSATLPRRKTTKAEIKLDYPAPKPATMGFKTEVAHRVEAPPKLSTQRSEVTVPLSSNFSVRSISLEPESKLKQTPKERIIPISFEKDDVRRENVISPPYKPPFTKPFQTQRSTISQRSNSLSRQSTQESDSETTASTGEPIRKSPREYIIPIAVEGGGYVTPRAGSLEPSDTASTTSTMTSKSKFGRRRLNEREGSEDESPFGLLHRHSSFGRDSDSEDPRRDMFRMHSLRSSRPRKAAIEHNDSFSSGEEDDDDGFEILTAENLFSTLLSRVRDLTSRLNVDGRPGFPTSRLLASHFDRDHSNFWNMHERLDPLSRYAPVGRTTSRDTSVDSGLSRGAGGVPWRRSVSRDLASDIDRVFKNPVEPPTHTATLPRGDTNSNNENLNLTDLNLKKLKLSDEDALALSYLTPGLSRRIQKQLFAQLAPSEAKKLSRTLSMRNPTDNKSHTSLEENKAKYKPLGQSSSTLPRRFSVENNPARYQNFKNNNEGEVLQNSCERGKSILSEKDEATSIPKFNRAFVPFKPYNRDIRSSTERTNIQNGCDYRKSYSNQSCDTYKLPSPDTTTSESLSSKNDDYSYKNSSTSNYSDTSRLVKYLTPNINTSEEYVGNKTDTVKRRSPSVKRASRFLRPDFYDSPKEESYYLKEKKEREIETQKVLKEIRDKRKGRFRDGSISRESSKTDVEEKTNEEIMKQSNTDLTHNLLKKVSDNIKNIESNVKEFHNYVNVDPNGEPKVVHDYVNVPVDVNANSQVIKKERVSRIARPKSYPNEAHIVAANVECDKKKLKSSKSKKLESNVKDNEIDREKQSNKNKFLQTIEKKFEKLRSFSNSPSSVCSDEKKSLVEDTIKRLREQSVPRNIENCSTESGLLKRAVSVEEIATTDPKQLQPSRKSVTKILSLFKKYEDKTKKGEKSTKPKKSKDESSKKVKDDTKKISKSKNSQLNVEKTDAIENELSGAPAVIENNNLENNSDITVENLSKRIRNGVQIVEPIVKIEQGKKMERPRSLLLDPTKRCQPAYNGAKSETNINDKDVKQRVSKLPVNSFRRSLNLDNAQFEPSNLYKISNGTISQLQDRVKEDTHNKVPYQNRFRMNPKSPESNINTDNALYGSNRNSYILTDDGSVLLSPCEDDLSYDSWSICSDYQNQDLTSPLSPSNNFYSADENESVSDRIRRKSFYTRFNEKKRPRKNTLNNYRDLDLYKEMSRKSNYNNTLDYRLNEPSKKYYVRSSSATLSDSISNISNQSDRYQMCGPRMNRRSTSVCPHSLDEFNVVDDNSAAEKNSNYSYYDEPSRFNDSPKSPPNGHRIANVTSSSLNHNILPSTSRQQL